MGPVTSFPSPTPRPCTSGLGEGFSPRISSSSIELGFSPGPSSPTPRSRNATTIAQLNKQAVTDISQTQCTAYCNAAGYTAQTQADQTATGAIIFDARRAIPRASKHRAAISYTAGITAAESALSTTINASAAPREYTPNTLNAPAISSG